MSAVGHDAADGSSADEPTIRRFLVERVAARCRTSAGEVDPDRPLDELGLTSRDAVAVAGELEERFGLSLPATLVYEHPTIARLAGALADEISGTGRRERAAGPVRGRDHAEAAGEPVAVVGLGCRFPGGIEGPAAYWRFLLDGGDAVGELPDGRWNAFGDGSPEVADRLARTTRLGGFLDDIAAFDAGFFGITPAEADAMDPQQRLLLEVAWEAFEHAGLAPAGLRGSRTGVFVGVSAPEYASLTATDPSRLEPWTATGAALSIVANRLSYLLDLRGPSMIVDTACSSSLVAVHLAVRSLRDGESDVALAGGVNALLSPMITMTFDLGGATAADGRCKAFDASADGMVRAEGCGVVVLKRLADARADGDRVLAVITGSAVNSDGRSNGLVAPNPQAQAEVVRDAHAGHDPRRVDYVEAHGTGTLLGDPIEARALGAVLGADRPADQPLLLGSAKSNLGHMEPAAGAAGLIKTVLALAHRTIPASLHYTEPNPHIDFDALGIRVVAERTPWPDREGPARAGVSSFGFGGTNAHIVVEETPAAEPSARVRPRPVHTLLLSDVAADRLGPYAETLADWLADSDAPPADVARTLAARFGRGRFRAAVVGRDRDALTVGLRALGEGGPAITGTATGTTGPPVWVFSGYGAQRAGMGRRLLADEPAFATAVDEIDALFATETGFSLWDTLERGTKVGGVFTTMTTLFGLQVALARLWRSYGVEPGAVIGHSMGEITAAVVSGALSLGDGVTVIARRSRLLATLEGQGAMLVLGCSATEAAELSEDRPDVHVAVRSSRGRTVVTGDADQLRTVAERAEERGLLARTVAAEGAGHSPVVEPILEPLRAELADIAGSAPTVPFYTTVLDDPRETPVFDADYWARNTRRPVRLVDAVEAAAADGFRTFIEVNAHPLLAGAIGETAPEALVVPTLRRARATGEEADDTVTFHGALGTLRVNGRSATPTAQGNLIDVPPAPWRHEHHWTPPRPAVRADRHPLLGAHVELPDERRHAWSGDVGTGPSPWLGACRVHDVAVLPAAAYAEIALAAGADAFGGDVVVTGLHLGPPLPLEENTPITTTLAADRTASGAEAGRLEVRAKTAAGGWTPPASATVAPAGEEAASRHADETPDPTVPPFVRRVAVPPAATGDRHFRAHPVVLDRCFGVLAGLEPAPAGAVWVPAVIGALRVFGPVHRGGTCVAWHVRHDDDTVVAAFRLVDDTGRTVAEATDVLLHGRTAVPAPLSAKLFEAVWVEQRRRRRGEDGGERRWLVLAADDDPLAVVPDGAAAHRPAVDWGDLEGTVRAALADTGPGGVADPPTDVLVVAPAESTDERLVLAVSGLVRGLTGIADRPPPRPWFVTGDRGEPRSGGDAEDASGVRAGQACLRSLVRVLGFEHPALRATVVEADDPAGLREELAGATDETEVAWRGGVRHVARLRPASLGQGRPRPVVRRGDAYLISGGYGGLGLATARLLAERGAGRIVLSGRRGPSRAARQAVDELRATGVRVEVVLGDIAEPGVAERMVATATAGGVALRGVVHAAGDLADHLVTDIGPEDLHRVWSPKVTGARRLHEATDGIDLDWWVAYSSAAALLGSPGQAAYAAAGGTVDALVARWRADGLPVATIDWGTWSEVGGATTASGPGVTVLDPIDPREGVEAFEALLAHDRAVTGVLRLDATRALAAFPEVRGLPYFSDLVGVVARHPTGDDWPGPAALRAAEPAVARAMLAERLRARVHAVLGFTPDPARSLTESGLDSLVAVRIKSALEHDLGVTVPAAVLLRGASIVAVRAWAEAELGIVDPAEPTAAPVEPVPATGGHGTRRADPVLPRDAAERQVVRVFEEVLGMSPIGVTDDFFALGGGPGQARRAAELLGERVGRDLDRTALLARPTAEDVADIVRADEEAAARRIVRPLTTTDPLPAARRPPFFCVHPAGGTTGVYRQLAALVAEDGPFFGLERLADAPSVEERAARYVELIREVRPDGPYLLGGWSFGGVLAYEIARLLGPSDVELVALIDAGLPKRVADTAEATARRYADFADYLTDTYGLAVPVGFDELRTLDEEAQLALVLERTSGLRETLPAAVVEHQLTSHADTRALERYRPGPYDGRVVLYRSTEPTPWAIQDARYDLDEANGFGDLCARLEIVPVPGAHHLNLLDPPGVHVIADHLGTRIARAGGAGTPHPPAKPRR